MLVDLYEYSAPRLCICDAVIAMEGNGPTQGAPRKIGCLIASTDGHRLDAVAAGLIGLKVQEIPTLSAAMRRGLLPKDPGEIRVEGDPARFTVPDFRTAPAQSNVFFLVFGDGILSKVLDYFYQKAADAFPEAESLRLCRLRKVRRNLPGESNHHAEQKA